MLRAARRQKVSAVVVVRLDRLARSLAHMARLGEELRELDVELVSLREGIDTRTPTGRAMFGMCGVFAQLEGDLIRDRTVAGLKAAQRRGVQLGRPRALDSDQHQRVLRLRRSGSSVRKIAELLGVGVATVHRVVKAS
jgi:DNA invertase Pin-like site-specific DNA recombinase